MPETREELSLSRTEIAMKARGVIAYQMRKPVHEVPETATMGAVCGNVLNAVSVLGSLRSAFDVSFHGFDFSDETMVGQLIDWIEGGIASV